MKNVMAELGTKLRKVKLDPQTSTDGSDLPDPFELLLLPPQGSLDPDQAPASPVGTEQGEKLHMEKGNESNRKGNRPATPTMVSSAPTSNSPPGGASASASAQNTKADVAGGVIAQEDGSISSPPPPPPPLPPVAPPTSTNHEAGAKRNPRVRPSVPVSMKDVAAELAAKVSARQRRSASPPIPPPPPPSTLPLDLQAGKGQEASPADKRMSSSSRQPVSMKGVMTELAAKARAREERLGATSPPSQLLPQPRADQEALSVQVGVKDVMRELEAKAKKKKERSAEPPPPPPPTTMTSGRQEKEDEGSTAPRKTTARGARNPVSSMKDMMAELEAAAKARGARSDHPPPSQQGGAASNASGK